MHRLSRLLTLAMLLGLLSQIGSDARASGYYNVMNFHGRTLVAMAVTPADSAMRGLSYRQFTAIGTYADGSTANLTNHVRWTSSSTSVASLYDTTGYFFATANGGTTTITAYLNGVSGSTSLTTSRLLSVVVTPGSATIYADQTQSYSATGTFEDGASGSITSFMSWSSSSTAIATMSSGGTATPGKVAGTTTITASISTTSGTVSSTATLTVPNIVSLAITPATPTLVLGKIQALTAIATMANSSTRDYTEKVDWSNSSSTIANLVDPFPMLVSRSPGTTTISATYTNTGNTVITASQAVSVTETGAIRSGFAATSMGRTDDGVLTNLSVGFTMNYFGTSYTRVAINNNGHVYFSSSGGYSGSSLSSLTTPLIAGFWTDISTSYYGNPVMYGTSTIGGRPAFGATWQGVSAYDGSDPTNYFQIIVIGRSDTGAGNFDIELNYGQIKWNSSAYVGHTNGSTVAGTYAQISGSGSSSSLIDSHATNALINNSLNSGGVNGRYVYQIRN